jgi:hypothetical protein
MPLILGDHRLDGRNLDDLMTKRRGIVSREGRLATATLLGFEDDHLIDLCHWHQGTRLARVTRLAAPTALPRRATGTLRLRRIARRRA